MKCLIVLLVSAISFIGCSNGKNTMTVVDASRDTSFLIKTNKSQTTTIVLSVKGNVDDTIMLQGKKIPGGKIHEKWQLDFYSKAYEVSYHHYKAIKGTIDIQYDIP